MMRALIEFMNTRFFNRLLVSFTSSSFSKLFIPLYRWIYDIDMSEVCEDQKFSSLKDFFIRKIDMNKRPISSDKFISPCDGVITSAGELSKDKTFLVKGHEVDVKALLNRDIIASAYQVIYLSPKDYHRFHAIDDNHFIDSYTIGSTSYPVNDWGLKNAKPFIDNYRHIKETDEYYYIAVGAVNVNSIDFTKDIFKQGDEIGYFSFGSTIVIIYKNYNGPLKTGSIKVRESLIN